jgi:hypothetical protein
VHGLSNAAQVTAGDEDTCALQSSGQVDCWGSNFFGDLGNGRVSESLTPVEVFAISDATQVAAGEDPTCALLSSGHVDCWGDNRDGELGNGTSGPFRKSEVPVEVLGIGDATEVAAGEEHACAPLSSGQVDCWGDNEDGELGNGTSESSDTPVEVVGVGDATEVTAGRDDTCALLSSGRVDCWGNNEAGELGNGRASDSLAPVEVQGIGNGTQVTAGGDHTCALLSSGHIDCWGTEGLGNGGAGSVVPSAVPLGLPVVVTGAASSVTDVAATLNATVHPEGGEVTGCEFQYGRTSAYGSSVPCSSPPGSGESAVEVSASVSSLSAHSTYHFRIVATSAAGTVYGEDATFTTESLPPDFGRCAKMPAELEGKRVYHGGFTTSTCKHASATNTGNYEWQGDVEKGGFTTTGGTAKLETVSKARVTCSAEHGTGQITSFATVGAVVITFSGCESEGAKCATAGQSEGILESQTLEGNLGWQEQAAGKVALAIYPVGRSGPFMEYSCGGKASVLTGSLLVPVPTNEMAQTLKLDYKASEGKQEPEAFEREAADVLENSLGERVGLTFRASLTSEEAVEINTAF